MITKLLQKLIDPDYRKAYVASQINIGIPFQIRALLRSRKWKQEDLAKRTGMLQPRISALLTPGKVKPNIETLRRIANAFDCALQVRFLPFDELAEYSEKFNPETFYVPSFEQEMAQSEGTDSTVALENDKDGILLPLMFTTDADTKPGAWERRGVRDAKRKGSAEAPR
jgi:transcriptional regulator with XRE-family HTH domain